MSNLFIANFVSTWICLSDVQAKPKRGSQYLLWTVNSYILTSADYHWLIWESSQTLNVWKLILKVNQPVPLPLPPLPHTLKLSFGNFFVSVYTNFIALVDQTKILKVILYSFIFLLYLTYLQNSLSLNLKYIQYSFLIHIKCIKHLPP